MYLWMYFLVLRFSFRLLGHGVSWEKDEEGLGYGERVSGGEREGRRRKGGEGGREGRRAGEEGVATERSKGRIDIAELS
jgi:hypothetical protein